MSHVEFILTIFHLVAESCFYFYLHSEKPEAESGNFPHDTMKH